jgi:hypothetical protein
MKKFLTAMSVILGLGLATAQQTAPAKATHTPPVVTKNTKTAATAPVKSAKPATKAATATPAPTGVKMKKDGTPDKRYKDNSKHLKKDGTPDKRYKENK